MENNGSNHYNFYFGKLYRFILLILIFSAVIVYIIYLINWDTSFKKINIRSENNNYLIKELIIKYVANNVYDFEFHLNRLPPLKKYSRIYLNIYPFNKDEVLINVKDKENYKLSFLFGGFQIKNPVKKDNYFIVKNRIKLRVSKVRINFGIFNPKITGYTKDKFLNNYFVFLNFNKLNATNKIYFIHPLYILRFLKKYFIFSSLFLTVLFLFIFIFNKAFFVKIIDVLSFPIIAFIPLFYLFLFLDYKRFAFYTFIFCVFLFFIFLVVETIENKKIKKFFK